MGTPAGWIMELSFAASTKDPVPPLLHGTGGNSTGYQVVNVCGPGQKLIGLQVNLPDALPGVHLQCGCADCGEQNLWLFPLLAQRIVHIELQ